MSIQSSDYITLPEIAKEMGVTYNTAVSWGTWRRYYNLERHIGRLLVKRTEFEKFKAAHPELIKRQPVGAGE